MIARLWTLVVLALALATGDVQAQARGATRGGSNRGMLEQRVRQRFAELLQRRLRLTDEQLVRLRETHAQFEARRRELRRDEIATRRLLRRELMRGDSADEQAVRRGMDDLLRYRREQLTILEQEAKALDGFLSPIQRARYFAMQEELRARMEEVRRRAPADGGAGRPARGRRGTPPADGREEGPPPLLF